MRREAAGEPPKGAAVITFFSAEGRCRAPQGRLLVFYSPRRGNPAKREPQPPPDTQLCCCVVVVCAVAGWESGKLPKAALQVQLRAAKRAALQQALRLCRRRSRRAGI